MELLQSQAVAIDGLSVRRIREEKRLTQLYVAKVVGVTTDTVSRWENNRYPTIRRDNAVKLAEALEVDLENILKQEVSDESCGGDLPSGKRMFKLKFGYLLVIIGLILVAAIYLIQKHDTAVAPLLKATRILPHYAAPGSQILVQVQIVSEKPLKGMILKETFPQGWQMIDSVPVASSVEEKAAAARWIFRNPPQTLKIYYILEVSPEASLDTNPKIEGEVIANPDGQHTAVAPINKGSLQVKPLHWADTNGNHIIDDMEILAVSEITEHSGDLDLGWDQIEQLWEAGGYEWQPKLRKFVPVTEPAH